MDAVRKKFRNLGVDSNMAIAYSARKGISPTIFYSFAETAKMSEKNLASLIHIHQRTIQNYHHQQKTLSPVESEHLLKIIALFIKGEKIFGNVEEFNYWLQKPFWHKKEKPIDWLITPGGVDLVSHEIDRLAQGYSL